MYRQTRRQTSGALIDSSAAAPTVTITEDANNDGIISASELTGDIDVSVGLPAGAVVGDTITVTDGTTSTPIVLTAAHMTANAVTTTFANPGDGSTISVTATLTDAVGNVSPDSAPDSALIDSSAAAPTVTITEDANNDGIISASELTGDIDVSVGLPAGAVVGDTITVTDGTTSTPIVLTAAHMTANAVTTTFANPGDGSTISVTATLTDAVGNVSPDSAPDSALIDSSAAAPTVTITEDANNDGIISASELTGDIDVSVGLPAGAVVGDTITVTDGTTSTPIVLTAAHMTANAVTTTFANPGDGSTISVTATLTDAVGNVSPDSAPDSALIDSSAAAPTVTITEDANNDGIISASELTGDIDVSVGLPAGAVVGDTITVTDGTTSTPIVLTAAHITANAVTTTFANPGDGSTISVTATLTDAVGNVSPDSAPDSALIDSSAAAPTVTITEDANNDGIISASELTGDIDVSVGLPAGAVVGDTITVTDGTTSTPIVLTAAHMTANAVTTTFANPGDGSTISVTATLTDAVGNVSPDSAPDSALIDSSAAAPTVTITEDANNDGIISFAELNGTVEVSVALPAGLVTGDTVTVIDGNGNTQTVILATANAAGPLVVSFPAPADGASLTVSATITDVAGNISPASATDTASVSLLIDASPIIATVDAMTPINGTTGGSGNINILSNDTLNGVVVAPSLLTLIINGPVNNGVTINPDGTTTVASGTPAGTYVVEYTICEILNPTNCSTTTATVPVFVFVNLPPVAENDSVKDQKLGQPATVKTVANDSDPENSLDPTSVKVHDPSGNPVTMLAVRDEGTWTVDPSTGDITFTPEPGYLGSNDTLNGVVVAPSFVTLIINGPVNNGVTINPDGTITVAPGTPAGTHIIRYTICETLNPTNCSSTTVSVPVTVNLPPVAVNDSSEPDQPLGQPVTVNTVSNDSDPDDNLDPTSVRIIDSSGNSVTSLSVEGQGTWTVNTSNGAITFTPNPDFIGDPTPINYTVKDTIGLESNVATVSIDYEEPAAITGVVWLDRDKDGIVDSDEDRKAGWTLKLKDADGNVVATTVTDSQGRYTFTGLIPAVYTIDFYNTSGVLITTQGTDGPLVSGQTINLPLPVDPSGVVYDSTTRVVLAGVTLQLVNSQGTPVNVACIGEGQQNQVTTDDGIYAFDVYPDAHASCPNGETYSINIVSAPAGYYTDSTIIPPQTGVFDSAADEPAVPVMSIANSNSCEVQGQPDAPQGNQDTTYYLDFSLSSGDNNVIFNHIPLDSEICAPDR